MSSSRAATLRDVAAQAGVSIATASHAINGTRSVGTEVLGRVRAAADELGYHPDVLARGLKTGSSRLITCIVSSLSNPLISAAVEGAHAVLRENGYGLLVFRSGSEPNDVSEGVEFAASYRSAGLIVFHPAAEDSSLLRRWVKSKRPITFVIHRQKATEADHVLMADETAALTATRFLLDRGHRQIGLLVRSLALEVYEFIAAGHNQALREAGISPNKQLLRGAGKHWLDSSAQALGYAETNRLLELRSPPTAILCAHNQIAVGALRALQDRGVAVPKQMSLLSFDRVDWMDITTPRITSIGLDGAVVGKAAAEQLLTRITAGLSGSVPTTTTLLPLSLFPGDSVSNVAAELKHA